MIQLIQTLGQTTLSRLSTMGRACVLLFYLMTALISVLIRLRLLIAQTYSVGVLTFLIVVVSGFFIGMVLGLQGYTTLSDFGAESALGQIVGTSLVRELGPVMAALLFAGRAGSALTAEIGLMKATEQLSGMEMMAVDPIKRIIAPRFWAGFISMPILALLLSAAGVLGGYLIGVEILGVDNGIFWARMQATIDFKSDLLNGIIKSVVFGFVVTWIAVFEGYDTIPTSEGVGQATTRTVVYSAFAILGLDFIMTALMFGDF
ncbi:MAG: lipid asymmetry maintenance ABC transporter permease subunit MlaE [Gammaproteobacteria bacterium]|nr:lipid asymmetry maintenance ABC transporter permease subunit MlaE [Gammaproteobacteria bacterium]